MDPAEFTAWMRDVGMEHERVRQIRQLQMGIFERKN
jgi:hypothetical protein